MNPSALLSKAYDYFENIDTIKVYEPKKLQDIYGYQYLILGDFVEIRASIHTDSFLENNDFGRFGGASIVLSTSEKLSLGSVVQTNQDLYAIEKQKPYNDKMQECDYICRSIYDYYKEFIIDSNDQSQRILGTNSMRYWLSMDTQIPLIPSMFSPNRLSFNLGQISPKYISIGIYNSQPLSLPYRNKEGLIEQDKRDMVKLVAVGLDTNELQNFAYTLVGNELFGISSFPSWKQECRYDKDFDLKANIQTMDIEVNYKIVGTLPVSFDTIIKKVSYNLNQIQRS